MQAFLSPFFMIICSISIVSAAWPIYLPGAVPRLDIIFERSFSALRTSLLYLRLDGTFEHNHTLCTKRCHASSLNLNVSYTVKPLHALDLIATMAMEPSWPFCSSLEIVNWSRIWIIIVIVYHITSWGPLFSSSFAHSSEIAFSFLKVFINIFTSIL